MEPFPLGLQTDLVTAPSGLVVRRQDDLLVIRTVDRPDFYFANKLFLPAPPAADDLPAVLDTWQRSFAGIDGIAKVVVQWESPYAPAAPAASPVLADAGRALGLELDQDLVLVLGTLTPRTAKVPMRARVVESDRDWQAARDVAVELDMSPGRREFYAWRQREHRRLVEAGRGRWWLAEADGQAVSTAGIFWSEDGTLGRFQNVGTAEQARNQGFASGLLSAMLFDLRVRLPSIQTCVIVATEGAQAERIYRGLGFAPVSRMTALWGDAPVS